jgi:hypothetical protein
MQSVPRFVYSFYVDNNPDYRACVLLAGSGRGGTTWLAEVINYDNAFRFMFEPFYSARVPECKNFGDYTYLRPQENNSSYLDPALSIFSGRVRNGWIDAYNRRLKADRRLVKDIRTNLMLGWVRAHFPGMPIILVLRHPCAVAHSRCKERWPADLERVFFSQLPLVEDYLAPFHRVARELRSDFERHVFWWCVETYVPLMQFTPGEILITTYEDCVNSPGTEVERIFDFLAKPFHRDVLTVVRKPSSQTRWNRYSQNISAIVLGDDVTSTWQQFVSRDDVARSLEILELFGLSEIYNAGPLPHTSSIERFMLACKARRSMPL